MTKQQVFEYLVIYHPSEKEAKAGDHSKIIVPATTVIAANQNTATLLAGRAIPTEYVDRLERVEVAVRPF